MPRLEDLITIELPAIVAVGAIVVLMVFEAAFPRMRDRSSTWRRHLPPIAVFWLLAAATSTILALMLQDQIVALVRNFKIFSVARLPVSAPLLFIASFLLIDLQSYVIHRLSHAIPMLWRLHAVHHSDEHVTAASGQLHHPLEVAVNYVFLIVFLVVLGVPAVAVSFYILLAGIHNAFCHADIALAEPVDRILRLVIVTPDLHRTHHSVDMKEGNSNFGQVFTFWDRLFGTYVAHPRVPERELKMGLPGPARPTAFKTLALLAYPFGRRPDNDG